MPFLITKPYRFKVTHLNNAFFTITLICWLFLVNQSWANELQLSPYKADYEVTRGGKSIGSGHRSLEKHSDDTWSFISKTKAKLFIFKDERTDTSSYRFSNGQLRSLEYMHVRTGTGSDKSYHYKFDPKSQIIVDLKKKASLDIKWDNQFDELNYQHQLKKDIASGKTEVDYAILGKKGDLKHYYFEVLGKETLTLPFGKLDTLKIRRIREDNNRETIIWLAPSKQYLLVKLQQLKNGKEQALLELTSVNFE